MGVDCDFVARAETEEELFKQVAIHAADVHKITEIPEEKMAQAKSLISEE